MGQHDPCERRISASVRNGLRWPVRLHDRRRRLYAARTFRHIQAEAILSIQVIRMLEKYSLNVVDPYAPLKPRLEDFLSRIPMSERIYGFMTRCFPQLRHFYGSGVFYKGTAMRGVGYRVCTLCGHKKKFSIVRPD